jgi:diaminohydroxyphosphoribosylaminopyrimidine deaminase / 5-amino-6-(5-phosphoribosylamino)uracil reductase
MTLTTTDLHWMRYALALAGAVPERQVSPNPRVGAVVLNAHGQVVGQGAHQQAGTPHAEVLALQQAGAAAQGGCIYVTLAPCNHSGKTPPCTQAIVTAGVRRVVYGTSDPNPLVAGQGEHWLQQAGLQVDGPLLAEACQALNPVFNHHITTGTPYTVLKLATTLDGYMSDCQGRSQWITGEAARHHVHQQRQRFTALLTTASTILADNPQLTVRLDPADMWPGLPPPHRLIWDQQGQLLACPDMPLIVDTNVAPTMVITRLSHQTAFQQRYPGVGVLVTDRTADASTLFNRVWRQLYADLAITSLWIEAGPRFASALLAEVGLLQQVWWYRSDHLLGGGSAVPVWSPSHPLATATRMTLNTINNSTLGPDSLSIYTP